MRVLEGLNPDRVFFYFEEISKIPRCSGSEKQVSDWLKSIGDNLGLTTIQDEALNIIVKKPASKGMEDRPTVILQGHMDMVCVKSPNYEHDFDRDPIPITVKDGYVCSESTTLGADNGIAVAYALAILESDTIVHPPLEVLITSDEEEGMTGASAVDKKNLEGKILINLDSEEEGTALVSCAGGERDLIELPIKTKKAHDGYSSKIITIEGLAGGHSGVEIHKQRANANKLIARLLYEMKSALEYDLISIDGGQKSNAIASSAKAVISIKPTSEDDLIKFINDFQNRILEELVQEDKGLVIRCNDTDDSHFRIRNKDSKRLINLLMNLPNGVIKYSPNIEGLVQTSNNVGVVSTEDEKVIVNCAIRSSLESEKRFVSDMISSLSEACGGTNNVSRGYPAWEFKTDSKLRDTFVEVYKKLTGKELKISALHAGLECGLFSKLLGGDVDMISIGPDLIGVHAPGEKMSIASVESTWKFLLEVLKEIK